MPVWFGFPSIKSDLMSEVRFHVEYIAYDGSKGECKVIDFCGSRARQPPGGAPSLLAADVRFTPFFQLMAVCCSLWYWLGFYRNLQQLSSVSQNHLSR